jgi:hypothetical protein
LKRCVSWALSLSLLMICVLACTDKPSRDNRALDEPTASHQRDQKPKAEISAKSEQSNEPSVIEANQPESANEGVEDSLHSDPKDAKFLPSNHIESQFISDFIDEIAGVRGNGRATGSVENLAVAQTIADQFKVLGMKGGGTGGSYFQAFNARGKITRNIIGILPGETDEFIVIGAHMDHLGLVDGQVYPGADDNASGTAGLVAGARAFAKLQMKLRRSIVFIAFSGEEMGLLGSLHFVTYPTIDLGKVKFMLNMDMIGRYREQVDVIGFEKTIEGQAIVRELLAKTQLNGHFLGEAATGRSDHMPFKQMGIPTGTFHTQLHADYHLPTDTVEKINVPALKTIAGVASDLAFRLANSESITSTAFALMPISVEGYTDGIHSQGGCEPALVSFEEVQRGLSAISPLP